MRTSRRFAALALVVATAVAGCTTDDPSGSSSGSKGASAKPSVSVSSSAPKVSPVKLELDASDVRAESSWNAPRYSAQWPTLPGSEKLSEALERQIQSWRRDYVGTYSGPRSGMTVVWEPVVNASGLYGIRLRHTVTAADSAATSTTLYGDGDSSFTSLQLIDDSQRAALVKELERQAVQVNGGGEPFEGATPEEVFTDVSFTPDGTLVAAVAEGTIGPMSAGQHYATVKNPERYLSDDGRRVREAAMKSPASSTSPAPSTSTTKPENAGKKTDCTKAKCIALTFDDGPGPDTNSILDTLEKKKARATFFTLGPAVQAAPATVRRMVKLGMGVGNHSWSHPQFTTLTDAQVTSEITRTADVLKKITGSDPVAVRPPYGAYTEATPHAGAPFVLWDIDTEDWKNRNADTTTKRVVDGAHPGAIVLMHDIHPSTAKAVPGIVDELQKQGYTLVTIDELIPSMTKDGVYSSAPTK
ncbi:hypothetical protein EVU97_08600 [Dermacoccus sp. 147Ba]|uniref:polysaccharide deacetylase family protein n=1 Tax=Dermacoccus sp. 147Ba TaxID=2510111 RepID=UPI00101BD48D|nr:polysaccharide deacetylase family protein [Dermacoccus sp. 147Ba]RYI22438.1 hypothetical protein EVU97_08600 [Dermacoccus sp. 147Ba]